MAAVCVSAVDDSRRTTEHLPEKGGFRQEDRMISHNAWVRRREFQDGINGQRIAIIGHSHHDDPNGSNEPDDDANTERTLEHMLSGHPDWQFRFFDRVLAFFDYNTHAEFWPRVLFMNFLPQRVAGIYDNGTPDQQQRGRDRFLKVMAEHKPDKIFVFSKKAWSQLPASLDRGPDNEYGEYPLGTAFPQISWCRYRFDNEISYAYGLKHPQYASVAKTRDAVRHILASTPSHDEQCRRLSAPQRGEVIP
jgi:hypothetical protein